MAREHLDYLFDLFDQLIANRAMRHGERAWNALAEIGAYAVDREYLLARVVAMDCESERRRAARLAFLYLRRQQLDMLKRDENLAKPEEWSTLFLSLVVAAADGNHAVLGIAPH